MYSIRRAIAESSRKPLLLLRSSQSYSTATNRKKSSRKSELGSTTTINSLHEESSAPEEANWSTRPSEIPFQSTVANSVNLIGYVHMPMQSGTSANGKYWAGTVIAHGAMSDSPPLRMPVMFEDNLAQSAASHIKQNDCVYVTGKLVTPLDEPLPFNPSLSQSSVQVLAHSVNFVDGSPLPQMKENSMKENSTSFEQEEETLKHFVSATVNKPGDSTLDFWRDLRDNPKQWRDYRAAKHDGSVKPKHPDFKHKERGHPLWVSTAPRWILSELRELKFEQIVTADEPRPQNSAYNFKDTKLQKCEDSWKDVLANPSKWWDNRVGKKNPKAPDFKHKDSGEALWLDSSPDWVKSQLPDPKNKDSFFGRQETILS